MLFLFPQGMFSVESAVRQLKPDFILNHVLVAEERRWAKVHLGHESHDHCDNVSLATVSTAPTSTSSGSDFIQDPGTALLR